jgi:alpha-L-glutamate ligase-like protein
MSIGWLKLVRGLHSRGVLGMNARNVGGILGHNPRALFPIVDDKLRLIEICDRVGVATPKVFAVIERHGDLRHLNEILTAHPDCVIKPARGSSGRGIVLLTGIVDNGFRRHNGSVATLSELRRHISDVLSGLYSLGGRPDRAMVQQRLHTHPAFERISYRGTPDVRVLVYRGEPAMAMLRLPTLESNGRANLHQGGVGVGVDIGSGSTGRAIWHGSVVDRHPDTGESLAGRQVPVWPAVLNTAKIVARATGLGYVGIDVIIDETGAMVLEANARPGLAIQSANGIGLRQVLEGIDSGIG